MRPKKIYIRPGDIQTGQDWDIFSPHATKAHTAEYTDLSQVWHTADEEVNIGSGSTGVVYQCEDGSTDCFYNAIDLLTVDRTAKPKIVRWAYIKDLLPEGGAE